MSDGLVDVAVRYCREDKAPPGAIRLFGEDLFGSDRGNFYDGGFLPDKKKFAVALNYGTFAGQNAVAMKHTGPISPENETTTAMSSSGVAGFCARRAPAS